MNVIGLMSGTSLDGIDVALLRSDGEELLEQGPFMTVPYDASFRVQLQNALLEAKQITQREERPGGLAQIEHELTLRHEKAVRGFLEENQMRISDIDLIGFHGQTVLHRPEHGITVQLGDGALLAKQTGVPVIYDMRAKDMENGGQGAPLAPAYHKALAANLGERWSGQYPVCFVNIGGISNLTAVLQDGDPIAFDCGTGNVLIDQWIGEHLDQSFDMGGEIALKGNVVEVIVEEYVERFAKVFADGRSLDRLDFKPLEKGICSLEDGARTLCAVTAQLIARSVERLPNLPQLFVLSGGGRLNAAIVAELIHSLPDHCSVLKAEELGICGDSVEAEAWGYLAIRSLKGAPLTYPSTTGVKFPCSGGKLAPYS